jgi:hypothetical protein
MPPWMEKLRGDSKEDKMFISDTSSSDEND